jgi:spectinomycin phosphotransferase
MRDEPAALPPSVLLSALQEHWAISIRSLEYAPVGAGSYHWIVEQDNGQRLFLTADNLGFMGTQDGVNSEGDFAGLKAAYETAAALRRQGLAFVLAPLADQRGHLVHRVLPEWALAVFPLVEGASGHFGVWADSATQVAAAEIIGELHRAEAPKSIRRWTARVPHFDALTRALGDLSRPWGSGPYGDRTRQLLSARRGDIEALIRRYGRMADAVMQRSAKWVVTHGEPHGSNFITAEDGSRYLIDWDTVRLAPPERDLWIVLRGDTEALAGAYTPDPTAMELFRVRWDLADICVYVRRFRQPHGGTEDDEASWQELDRALATAPTT